MSKPKETHPEILVGTAYRALWDDSVVYRILAVSRSWVQIRMDGSKEQPHIDLSVARWLIKSGVWSEIRGAK